MSPSTRERERQTPADEALAQHREELKKRFPLPAVQPRPKRRNATTLGALLVFAVGLAAWLDPAWRSEHYATAIGQRQSLELADGSRITLDGASRLEVSWHLRSRRVELQAGQALFDVTPARHRPFRVTAGPAEVQVVGTRFNLDRQADDLRVTVSAGRVAVRGTADSTQLVAGDQVLVRAGQLEPKRQVDAERFSAWQNGRQVFQRTPLREVLAALQRYRAAPIRLDDPALAELPVSGVFDSREPERLLALLPRILPVALATAPDGTLHLTAEGGQK
ncbi:fec operon regulator FecR [compost metagenome]